MSRARVLVVDDEPGVLSLVSKALSRRGYEVESANHPLQALAIVETAPPFDLVVSDVIMPQICGPQLVKRITEICPGAAVVLMSGHLGCEILPANCKYIGKPFMLPDLFRVVEQALEQGAGI
jgi:DNA-binding NtrC family response regulator